MDAIRSAKPLEEQQLLENRDGHVEGRGFEADDIAKLREAIQQSERTAVKQLEFEKQVMREREERGWRRKMEEEDAIDADYVHVDMPSAAKSGGQQGTQRGEDTDRGEEVEGAEEAAEVQPAASGSGLTSKQARVQAAMRDTSLTPQERQRRIQEIMREPVPEAAGDEKKKEKKEKEEEKEGGRAGSSKQERVRKLMQDTSLTPQERQRRIQEVMSEQERSGAEEAGTTALLPLAPLTACADQESKKKLLEAQKRVKALLAAGKAEVRGEDGNGGRVGEGYGVRERRERKRREEGVGITKARGRREVVEKLGAITTVSAEETKLADDRPVEVRIVLGDDTTGVREERGRRRSTTRVQRREEEEEE
eukprot:204569-Hanusia_phi.AAC.1